MIDNVKLYICEIYKIYIKYGKLKVNFNSILI